MQPGRAERTLAPNLKPDVTSYILCSKHLGRFVCKEMENNDDKTNTNTQTLTDTQY